MNTTTENKDITEHFGSAADGFKMPPVEEQEAPEKISVSEDDSEEEVEISYHERLDKLEISEERAHEIIDDICEKGSYMQAYVVRKKRKGKKEIKVVFATRDSRSQGFIIERVSMMHKSSPIVYNKLIGELQIAASIIHLNGNTYSPLVEIENDEEFEKEILERVKEFSKLPAPIAVVIGRKLSEFDLQVAAVMAPGYEDFF